ncbi:hypothetical protein [uncultured Mucilaginibacter sp.]|uniref:hypothetical protein n=1 Tax=uncultured Mucilaginibacter sp. TaxID=797541 RepID=UPI00262B46AE|nr:hypothetical protein [uncultured Mucilaginibacter sp.]
MKLAFNLFLVFILFVLFSKISFAKNVRNSKRLVDTILTFHNDTLFSNIEFKIFIGQKLTIGKGSDDGRYQTVSFKSPFALPTLLNRNLDIKNNIEYQNDPSLRDQDKVKESLNIGQPLIVTKIKLTGNTKRGFHYLLYLATGTSSFSNKFVCGDISYALKLKELLIQ